jgi:hypothetical protein
MKFTHCYCLILAILTSACAPSLKTTSKTENGVTFSNYKTYAWVAPHDAEEKSRADDKRFAPLIKQLCDEALTKKGLKLDALHPDALFAFDTRIEERVKYKRGSISNPNNNYLYGGAGYYPGVYVGSTYYENNSVPGGEIQPEEYDQGMMGIQMFDAKTKKVLWRGYAEKELTAKTDAEATIKKAVKDIFILLPIKN